MRSLSAPRTVTGDEFWWGDSKVWRHQSLGLCLKCLWLLMIISFSCRGAAGCILRRLRKRLLTGEENHLDDAGRQILQLRWQVAKQWGGQEIMSLEILIDFKCSLSLADEIYTYQIFFIILVIIHTIWIGIKACSYFGFYLNLQLFSFLPLLLLSEISLEVHHVWAKYYSLFSKMLSGKLKGPLSRHRQNIHSLGEFNSMLRNAKIG